MIARAGPTLLAKLLAENIRVYSIDRCPALEAHHLTVHS